MSRHCFSRQGRPEERLHYFFSLLVQILADSTELTQTKKYSNKEIFGAASVALRRGSLHPKRAITQHGSMAAVDPSRVLLQKTVSRGLQSECLRLQQVLCGNREREPGWLLHARQEVQEVCLLGSTIQWSEVDTWLLHLEHGDAIWNHICLSKRERAGSQYDKKPRPLTPIASISGWDCGPFPPDPPAPRRNFHP